MTLMTDPAADFGNDEAVSRFPGHHACPPWCEIDDHDDWDGGEIHHDSATTVGMTLYPYEVTSTESGAPVTTQCCDYLNIARVQVRDHEQVVVVTHPPVSDALDPDGVLSVPGQFALTFAEARDAAVALLVMTGPAEGSLHFACAPGDPSPCCPDSPLGASAYPPAVFCPSCGSLYWRR